MVNTTFDYIDDLVMVKKLKEKNEEMYHSFKGVVEEVQPLLDKRIIQVFKDYTLHDLNHSLRIIAYMGDLVPELDDLNELEIAILLYSALLHDIGMAATEEELEDIKNGDLKYFDLDFNALKDKFGGDERLAFQDYIRRVHGFRSAEFIRGNLGDKLTVPSMKLTSFEEEVAAICQAHTESVEWLTSNLDKYGMKGHFSFNAQFCAVLLRLGDILDFDSQRTPPQLFSAFKLTGISHDEWVQHFSIDNSSKIRNTFDNYKLIELHGKCDNPYVHRKILGYMEAINEEIENANNVTEHFQQKRRILIHPKVSDFIKSQGYSIANMKFEVSFDQITKLLMGEQLYGDRKYGLRELIQNSIDACQVRKELMDNNQEFQEVNEK